MELEVGGVAGAVFGAVEGGADTEVVGGLDVEEARFADGKAFVVVAVDVKLKRAGIFGSKVDGEEAASVF